MFDVLLYSIPCLTILVGTAIVAIHDYCLAYLRLRRQQRIALINKRLAEIRAELRALNERLPLR